MTGSHIHHEVNSKSPLSKALNICGRGANGCAECLRDSLLEPQKQMLDHIVLVTTMQVSRDHGSLRHYEERPEIEQDYQQLKSGGWQLKKLSSTRYSEIVFYIS